MQSHPSLPLLESILEEWLDLSVETDITSLDGSTGLSGAQVWKAGQGNAHYCVKRWPPDHFSREELTERHNLLHHVHSQGCSVVPLPVFNKEGSTTVCRDEYLWDVTNWLPGNAMCGEELCGETLSQALRSLAEFHLAAERFSAVQLASPPGLTARLDVLRSLAEHYLDQLEAAVGTRIQHVWSQLLGELLAHLKRGLPSAVQELESAAGLSLPLQWCLRDVKCDHVLMQHGRVTGLIDYGAAAIDVVSGDLARLLGSASSLALDQWPEAVGAYAAIRPLTTDEARAIRVYHKGGLLVAAANWLRWIAVENREFEKPGLIEKRLNHLCTNLRKVS